MPSRYVVVPRAYPVRGSYVCSVRQQSPLALLARLDCPSKTYKIEITSGSAFTAPVPHSQYAEADPRLALPTRSWTADERLPVFIAIPITYMAAEISMKPAPFL